VSSRTLNSGDRWVRVVSRAASESAGSAAPEIRLGRRKAAAATNLSENCMIAELVEWEVRRLREDC